MAIYDERGVIIPAPVQGHLGGERYDDEHRGPAVTEAYSLSRCWIDLAEHSRNWSEPDSIPDHLQAISQNHPPETRDGWLKDAANREVMEKLLSYALRSGELPLWVAPLDGPEKPVPAESILEMDHATMVSGTYRPPNDRGWLHGRPLFIKWSDWVKFVAKANAEKEFPPASGNGEGKVPANRQLDHKKILERVREMRAEQTGLSKGSAAASIVAELPPNPKTGKPRDQRGIERIIAHLWEGKAEQSPQ